MRIAPALTFGLAFALACGPAVAQNAGQPPAQQQPPAAQQQAEAQQPAPAVGSTEGTAQGTTTGTATISPNGIPPSQRNPLLTDGGKVRISKLLGTTIYNKDDKEVGTVQDVLADQNGQLQAVVSTNGKRVVAPWNKLQFGDAKLNSHNKVLMLDETQQSLASLPAFNPQGKSQGNPNKKG